MWFMLLLYVFTLMLYYVLHPFKQFIICIIFKEILNIIYQLAYY